MGSYYVTPPDDTTQPQPGIPTPPGGVPSSAQVQPITAPPPGVAAQPKGPFSSYLDPSQVREPTHVASKERPSGYMGPAGKMAMVLDQFLGGLAKGRADSYNKSIKDQAAQYGRFDKALDDIGKMPDVTDADKRKLAQPILDAKLAILRGEINPDAVDGKDGKKGGGKKGKDQEHPNPIVHFIGQMADKVAGPGAQPQRMSGEYVSQVLGQVYPQMHALVGQRQQTEDANKEYMAAAAEAIGAVGADKEVNVADLWKSERFQAAHAKLAGLTKDGKISPDMVKPLEDMMKRRNAKPAEVELQDGSKIPVTVESDGTVKSGTTVMPPGSYKQLLWPGRMATETKPKPSADEQRITDEQKRIVDMMGLPGVSDLSKKDQAQLGIIHHASDDVKTRFFEKLQDPKLKGDDRVSAAYDEAYKEVNAKKREADEHARLENVELRKRIMKLDKDMSGKASLKPKELEGMAVSFLQGVHPNPGDEVTFKTDLETLRSKMPGTPDADNVAAKMLRRAISNAKDPTQNPDWSPERRAQLVAHLERIPLPTVQKVFNPATEAKTTLPPGVEKPAPKAAAGGAAAPQNGVGGPPPKAPQGQITVKIPGQPYGFISADKKAAFLAKHKNAQVF